MKYRFLTIIMSVAFASYLTAYILGAKVSLFTVIVTGVALALLIGRDIIDRRNEITDWNELQEELQEISKVIFQKSAESGSNHCVVCGKSIPEGTQYCPDCWEKTMNGEKK